MHPGPAEQSLASFGELGDGWGRLQALDALATHDEIGGDYDGAEGHLHDARRTAEGLQMWGELSWILSRLGRIAMLQGEHEAADRLLTAGRAVAVQHSHVPEQEFADVGLALTARHQGRLDEAEALLSQWLGWNREVEADYGAALILAELGFVAELRGDAVAARTRHRDGLAAARGTGDIRALALALEGLAGAESLAGDHLRAARMLGAAAAARESVGAPLPAGERHDVDRIAGRIRAAIGEEAYAAELAHGRASDARRAA